MQTALFLTAALVLVIFLIRTLHRRQLRYQAEIAEQSAPLPPLEREPSARRQTINVADEIQPATQAAAVPWQDEVRALRDAGRFQEAMALCRRQYPRMLAFRQSMVTLRARIKSATPDGTGSQDCLQDLYRTAVMGELLRQTDDEDDKKALLERLASREFSYRRFGHAHLTLLTKTDRKLLEASWGKPEHHQLPQDIIESGSGTAQAPGQDIHH